MPHPCDAFYHCRKNIMYYFHLPTPISTKSRHTRGCLISGAFSNPGILNPRSFHRGRWDGKGWKCGICATGAAFFGVFVVWYLSFFSLGGSASSLFSARSLFPALLPSSSQPSSRGLFSKFFVGFSNQKKHQKRFFAKKTKQLVFFGKGFFTKTSGTSAWFCKKDRLGIGRGTIVSDFCPNTGLPSFPSFSRCSGGGVFCFGVPNGVTIGTNYWENNVFKPIHTNVTTRWLGNGVAKWTPPYPRY